MATLTYKKGITIINNKVENFHMGFCYARDIQNTITKLNGVYMNKKEDKEREENKQKMRCDLNIEWL